MPFLLQAKGTRVLEWQKDINVVFQNRVSTFGNFNFYPRYFGKLSLCPWNQTYFLIKVFYLSTKTNLQKSETRFCRPKTAEDNNTKINVFSNIPCTFLLFKTTAFLQIFFPRSLLFRQVLRMSVFLNNKCLTFLYLLSSLLKNFN